MESTSLINDIIKTNSIHFRNIKIGDAIELIEQIEGPATEKKEYSNPFYNYYFEIGEMEEMTVYYNFNNDGNVVKEISLYFIHYPDHYWKKEGHSDPVEFWDLLQNNKLQPYSTLFTNTASDVITFFTKLLDQEPTHSSEINGVFDKPHQNYKKHQWTTNEYHIFIQTYIDDSIDNAIKNTMKLTMREV